jgi:hypothetical protein
MALVYRSSWQANDSDAEEACWTSLARQALKSGLNLPAVGAVRTETASAMVRRAADESAAAMHIQLTEQQGAAVITNLTFMRQSGSPAWMISEVEVIEDGIGDLGRIPEAPPWAVELLSELRCYSGPVVLGPHPVTVDLDAESLAAEIFDRERGVALVLLAVGASLDLASARLRAKRIARRLSGVMVTRVLTPAAAERLRMILGEPLAVPDSCVRLYLPGIDRTDPQPLLHRVIYPDQVGLSPDATADRVARALAPRIAAASAPADVRSTIERLFATASVGIADLLAAKVFELERSLEQLRALGVEQSDRCVELFDEIERLTAQNIGFAAELRRLRGLVVLQGRNPFDHSGDVPVPDRAPTCRRALDQAREHLEGLVIPDSAYGRVDELDEALESATWANVTWRALRSLHTYAISGEGSYFTWCTTSGDPFALPPKAFAMTESESVMNNRRMSEQRRFEVDTAVESSGRVLMLAHVKIERVGPVAPRLYFLDDTGGVTGKVHIGYLGPHLTNTRTN